LEEAQPAASEKSSSSQGLSVPEPACSGTHSGATLADDVFSAANEVQPAPNSPHKEFHSAVVRALIKDPLNVEAAEGGQASDSEQPVEPEEDDKDPKPTSTPPSTPIRAEEESLPEQTFKDESDPATLRQTLPDLTPDDPSEAPALPAEDSTPAAATAEAAEGEEAADAGDQEGEESPGKSPSKKKKKFRTPSFLKKNKK
ncbi:hypothetical protein CRENBAI_010106, partial [Crenichthys baileyi]